MCVDIKTSHFMYIHVGHARNITPYNEHNFNEGIEMTDINKNG